MFMSNGPGWSLITHTVGLPDGGLNLGKFPERMLQAGLRDLAGDSPNGVYPRSSRSRRRRGGRVGGADEGLGGTIVVVLSLAKAPAS